MQVVTVIQSSRNTQALALGLVRKLRLLRVTSGLARVSSGQVAKGKHQTGKKKFLKELR